EVVVAADSAARITQEAIEAAIAASAAARATQGAVEVVVVATSQQARVTQEFVEVLERYAIPHVTQQPVEVVLTVTGAAVKARVTQQPVEAVIVVTAGARVTQMFAGAPVASEVIPGPVQPRKPTPSTQWARNHLPRSPIRRPPRGA